MSPTLLYGSADIFASVDFMYLASGTHINNTRPRESFTVQRDGENTGCLERILKPYEQILYQAEG